MRRQKGKSERAGRVCPAVSTKGGMGWTWVCQRKGRNGNGTGIFTEREGILSFCLTNVSRMRSY